MEFTTISIEIRCVFLGQAVRIRLRALVVGDAAPALEDTWK